LTQVSSVGKRFLAQEEFIENKPSGKHIRCWTCRLGVIMALRGKVVRIKFVDDLLCDRVAALSSGTCEVKTCQAYPSVAPNENRRRVERSVYNLVRVSMR
jgi:hypothetical protein